MQINGRRHELRRSIYLNLSLKSPSKWINYGDNGHGNDKVRVKIAMCSKKDIYLTFIMI